VRALLIITGESVCVGLLGTPISAVCTALSTMAGARVCELCCVHPRYECRAARRWQSPCQLHTACM